MSDPARPVLLTVSGTIPEDLDESVGEARRPRADYRVMQEHFDADLVDAPAAVADGGRLGRALHRIGGAGLVLAWFCFRRRNDYEVIVTDGEQVGIPFAILCRVAGRGTARHLMIVHILSVPKKARLVRWTRTSGLIDRYVVYCSWQARFIETELGVPADHVILSPFMVDTDFFDPAAVEATPRRMICSAGLERRDYATLMAAVADLDVEVVVAAASPWSKRPDSTGRADIPANVKVVSLSLFELRELYAESALVVMPLEPVEFQAGITTILEAMAMARPVVCTRTSGQTDTIIEGVTGEYVAPGDAAALRESIRALLDDVERRRRLGEAARAWAIEHADVTSYAANLATHVAALR